MAEKVLMILEVSQKQAFIFGAKELRNNICNSDAIAYVTSSQFFKECFSSYYKEEENLIYAGGGHTILVFDSKEKAKVFAQKVSFYVLKHIPDLELFIKIEEYDSEKSESDNIKALLQALEVKKSRREASFYQRTIGIEKVESINSSEEDEKYKTNEFLNMISEDLVPDKESAKHIGSYQFTNKFSKLGGTKNDNNFIAVIHIDGNQMGARVQKLEDIIKKGYEKERKKNPSLDRFKFYCEQKRLFSESIDQDFKAAFYEMLEIVTKRLDAERESDTGLAALSLEPVSQSADEFYFPIRKVILAGDDVCFITEGRIGLECAALYIDCLTKESRKNKIDGQNYAACAGVAIVHQKYPFYRAYEMAEQLCSNAKKEMAKRIQEYNKKGSVNLVEGSLSAIDWHIEYGEMIDELDEIREGQYQSMDQKPMYNRPYQITAFKNIPNPVLYDDFKANLKKMQDINIARSKLKGLRSAIKTGQNAAEKYCRIHFIPEYLYKEPYSSLAELFDILEAMDLFLPIEK